jgi:hypothetical protein
MGRKSNIDWKSPANIRDILTVFRLQQRDRWLHQHGSAV